MLKHRQLILQFFCFATPPDTPAIPRWCPVMPVIEYFFMPRSISWIPCKVHHMAAEKACPANNKKALSA
jgi:hypothetical protein